MKIYSALCAVGLSLIGSTCFGFASLPVWVNGVPVSQQADVATLISPATITMNAGDTTPTILGSLYKSGVTEAAGPASLEVAQLGYGAYGSDPRTSTWTWLPVIYDQQLGTADEYMGSFSMNTPGVYAYTYRFSLDNGGTWTAADLAGCGENPAVAFNASDIGTLTVNSLPVPEPAVVSIVALSLLPLWLRRRGPKYQ